MERRARVRITTLVVIIAMVFGLFGLRIYKLQSALTEEEKELQDSLTYQTTVQAARGPILDRNGTVLVTNRPSYNLVIISYVWRNGPTPNESLQELRLLLATLYNYRKFVFDGIKIDDSVIAVYADFYYIGDVNYDEKPYGSLLIYHNEEAEIKYSFTRNDIKALESYSKD